VSLLERPYTFAGAYQHFFSPKKTRVWSFFNSFREAQCKQDNLVAYSGTPIRNWPAL
jgi:hypothetical protein